MCDWACWERLLATRCSICLFKLLSVFILIATSAVAVRSQSCMINATKNVLFLGFIPCRSQPSLNGSSISRSAARKILEKCDVLVQSAVELAVERINCNWSPDILANTTLHVLRLSDSSEVRGLTLHPPPFYPSANDQIGLIES